MRRAGFMRLLRGAVDRGSRQAPDDGESRHDAVQDRHAVADVEGAAHHLSLSCRRQR